MEHWLEAWDNLLKSAFRRNVPMDVMARLFDVPQSVITTKLWELGLVEPPTRKPRPPAKTWTEEEVATLRENYHAMLHIDLAERLGRTKGAIRAKARNLGIQGG